MKVMLWTAISLAAVGTCFAAGSGAHHEPSIKDLLWPAVNFFLLFGFMAWKLKKPVCKSFTQKSEDIAEVYAEAGKRFEDAKKQHTESEKQLESLDGKASELKEKSELEVREYEARRKEETEVTITKMKSDCATRIEHEKNQLAKKANADLIDEVVRKTKENISKDGDMKNSVTEKLLAGLQ